MTGIVGAFLGAPDATISAGFAGISLCINTTDRQNLDTASFTVVAQGFSQTVQADASGRAYVEVPSGKTYTITLNHQGMYQNDGPQTVIAESMMRYGVLFDLFGYSDIATIVRVRTAPGITITGTSGANSLEIVAGDDGIAEFRGLPAGTTWTFTGGSGTETVMIDRIYLYIDLSFAPQTKNDVSYEMSLDSAVFATDPTGCLTYTGNCAGFTPVSSPPSEFGPCSVLGSWDMNEAGRAPGNPLLDSCFYATFDSEGNLHEKLNPWNLAEAIGIWDYVRKGWVAVKQASSIETENTMFCFPALYRKGDSSSVTIGTTSASGTAWGATIDGHTYKYEAIGVYSGYIQDDKLMSLSGKAASGGKSLSNFRICAAANKVKDGKALLWNFHHWRDWGHLCIFAGKSFNGQQAIGKGGLERGLGAGQGICNTMGLWAGSASSSSSIAMTVKALIESPWAYFWELIDDFVNSDGTFYVGQNSIPDNTTSNKISSYFGTDSGYQSGLKTDGAFWGLGDGTKGNSRTYQCDFRGSNTGTHFGAVGGLWHTLSGYAGISLLDATFTNGSSSLINSRLAFVFDLDV